MWLTVRDQYGNVRVAGTDRVSLDVSGAVAPTTRVSDELDRYRLSFLCSRSGAYQYTARVNDAPLKGSPFSIEVVPGLAFAPLCELKLPLPTMEVGRESRIQLTAKDPHGNRMLDGGAAFQMKLQHVGNKKAHFGFKSVDKRDGTYEFAVSANVSGRYTMTVAMDGQPICGSPFELSIGSSKGAVSVAI